MLFLESVTGSLARALFGLSSSLLRVDWEEIAPPRKSLLQRLTDLFSGKVDFLSIFDSKCLVNWVEVFVILSILLFAGYVAHALNLFGKRA